MKSTIAIVVSVLAVVAAIMLVNSKNKENFTADGWVFNQPPNWFNKIAYNPEDWLVAYYPDQLSQPGGCDIHYRGNNSELNYLSSAYRFWRM